MENYLPHLFFALTWAVLWLVLVPVPEIWRGLKRQAPRFLARPRIMRVWERGRARMGVMHAYLPTMTILAFGIVATLMIGEEFVELAVLLRHGSPLVLDIDRMVYRWAASMRSDPATLFFLIFTYIGSPASLAVIAIGVTVLLFAQRHRGLSLYVAVTSSMAGLINLLLKQIFARTRPDLAEALRKASGYSFPSGHAMESMVVLGSLAYVVARVHGRWRLRSATIAALLSSILAVGLSRVYLGVHWISDIAAGYVAGMVWLVVATVAFEAFWRIREIRSRKEEP